MSATPQQYCLRWNNYQNNLTNVFDQLLQSEAFVDCSLACDGQSLKCHKMVLSACSPFFQNLFFDNPCSHPIVILKDIRWEELKAVVEFMYRGEINVSQEQLAPLLKVAEVLKIRGLADVSRGSGSDLLSTSTLQQQQQQQSSSQSQSQSQSSSSQNQQQSSSSHGVGGSGGARDRDRDRDRDRERERDRDGSHALDSDNENSSPPGLGSLARNLTPNGNGMMGLSGLGLAHVAASLRRKRRKISTPDRSPSPADTLDDQSNPHELDSNNGDYMDHSPALSSCEPSASVLAKEFGIGGPNSANNTPSSTSMNSINPGGQGGVPLPSSAVAALSSMGPAALLNLHNAAAAANSSSVSNELDLKPGIVEMIREEERAKMMESSHGWMGPASQLSDSYQYQIQSLWQKCWNTNQSGMIHALRFRERGPLKSWRPETMAEAIFAVLREGLSLSQAARKFDIPYPTFVLYANRVHNMLGPSADGCSGTDLISDNRPKGRGRPQRILLGTWPEDHIRGVIRAVVFRDTGGKDDVPFLYGRESGMMVPPQPGTSHNGLDMSLHPQFGGSGGSSGGSGNPFLSPLSSSSSAQQQQQQQQSSISNPIGGASSSMGSSSSSTNHHGGQSGQGGGSPLGLDDMTPAQLQLLQKHHQQQLLAAATAAAAEQHGQGGGGIGGSGTSSRDALAGLIGSSVLQQHHHQRLHSHHSSSSHHHLSNRSGSSSSSASSSSIIPLLKGSRGERSGALTDPDDIIMHTNPEILQIKAEIAFEDLDEDEDPEDINSEDDEITHPPAVSVISSTSGMSNNNNNSNTNGGSSGGAGVGGNINNNSCNNNNNNNNSNSSNGVTATATAAVVVAPSPVQNNSTDSPTSHDMTSSGNHVSSADGNNFLQEPEVNTVNTPPPFQAS